MRGCDQKESDIHSSVLCCFPFLYSPLLSLRRRKLLGLFIGKCLVTLCVVRERAQTLYVGHTVTSQKHLDELELVSLSWMYGILSHRFLLGQFSSDSQFSGKYNGNTIK
jgi:hypothetical protein